MTNALEPSPATNQEMTLVDQFLTEVQSFKSRLSSLLAHDPPSSDPSNLHGSTLQVIYQELVTLLAALQEYQPLQTIESSTEILTSPVVESIQSENSRLKLELIFAQTTIKGLRCQNAELRRQMVDLAAAAEVAEEAVTNRLLTKIAEMKQNTVDLVGAVEQEEERLVNQLHRKLSKALNDKVELERQLETEQEYIVNRLQKQLEELRAKQDVVAGSTEKAADSLEEQVLRAELQGCRLEIRQATQKYEALLHQMKAWRDELIDLRRKAGKPSEDLFQIKL